MKTDKAPGNTSDQRHVFGPRPVGALMPRVTRPAFRKRAPSSAQLMTDWTEIVGPALAAVTYPVRLTSGTLTVSCAGPVALELQHLAGPLTERINAHLGRVMIDRLRFVQHLRPAQPSPAAGKPPHQAVEIAGMPPSPLRDALAALGAHLAGPPRRDPA